MNATRLRLTRTAVARAQALGFGDALIADTFANPKKVYRSKAREGQWRIVSRDVCLVGFVLEKPFCSFTICSVLLTYSSILQVCYDAKFCASFLCNS